MTPVVLGFATAHYRRSMMVTTHLYCGLLFV